jgi:hypothetical protein
MISVDAEKPIMIGGCGSSGTTLLSHLLNAHPSIYCGPELYLLNKRSLYERPFKYTKQEFSDLLEKGLPTIGVLDNDILPSSTSYSLYRDFTFIRAPEKYGFTKDKLCNLASKSENFGDFVREFFRMVLQKNGKTIWAEKTPTNCYCIGHFLSLFPRSRYIHVIRDGRDVVISLIKRGASPESAVRRWLYDIGTGFLYRKEKQYYEIKYENLVTNPTSTLADLLEFLDVSPVADLLVKSAREFKVLETTHKSWGQQPNASISKMSIGKWKKYKFKGNLERLFHNTEITKEVADRLGLKKKYSANDVLTEFGYHIDESWNLKPKKDLRILFHILIEITFYYLFRRKLYCQISTT